MTVSQISIAEFLTAPSANFRRITPVQCRTGPLAISSRGCSKELMLEWD